uniref:Uncharacterized protein n=1 Tax=Euglena viridis TaxID=3040 RepID=M1EWB1_EUGVI|nr:hypothetical protein I642_p066 [Euglena viridis]AEY70779.1 hypothetical protein [Euglena viridis]
MFFFYKLKRDQYILNFTSKSICCIDIDSSFETIEVNEKFNMYFFITKINNNNIIVNLFCHDFDNCKDLKKKDLFFLYFNNLIEAIILRNKVSDSIKNCSVRKKVNKNNKNFYPSNIYININIHYDEDVTFVNIQKSILEIVQRLRNIPFPCSISEIINADDLKSSYFFYILYKYLSIKNY